MSFEGKCLACSSACHNCLKKILHANVLLKWLDWNRQLAVKPTPSRRLDLRKALRSSRGGKQRLPTSVVSIFFFDRVQRRNRFLFQFSHSRSHISRKKEKQYKNYKNNFYRLKSMPSIIFFNENLKLKIVMQK